MSFEEDSEAWTWQDLAGDSSLAISDLLSDFDLTQAEEISADSQGSREPESSSFAGNSPPLKRRRMLQFSEAVRFADKQDSRFEDHSGDLQMSDPVGADSFLFCRNEDLSGESLENSSETWMAGCINEGEIPDISDDPNASGGFDDQIDLSDDSNDIPLAVRSSKITTETKPLVQSYYGVPAASKGEGLPYAPQGWPNPEDKWGWQVGKRTNLCGSWRDRYLSLPKSLTKGHRAVRFQSKLEVKNYLTETFPGLDLEKFFASFQWQVPAYFPLQMATTSNTEEEVASGMPNFSNTFAVDRKQRKVIPDLRRLPANIRALTVEKEVDQALYMLRKTQEKEYVNARDKLLAQKDLLVTFLQPANGSLSSSALEKAFEKELEKFRNMLGITNDNTSREFLRHHIPKG